MPLAEDLVMVTTTVAEQAEADRLAAACVEARLAACVQCEAVSSVYRWQGKVETAREYRLNAKTTRACRDDLMALIQRLHSYETPEIVSISIEKASDAYGAWIRDETG